MDPKLVEIQKLLDAADGNLSSARTLVREMSGNETTPLNIDTKLEGLTPAEDKIIEGVFDGEMMIAADGKTYPVPPNYASKSKLVEGDTLKLTINDDGTFVFKQISPVDRRNAIGTLALDNGNYTINAEGKSYKVLTASVTFYKANPGDQITIILPKEQDAVWAVMENVVPKSDVKSDSLPASSIEPPAQTEKPAVVAEKIIAEPIVPVIPAQEPQSSPGSFVPSQDDEAEAPKPEVVADAATPEIEFPGGTPTISDEQLLENLKNNLQKIDQPAYTPPGETAPKPASLAARQVDNIVASDLAHIEQQKSDVPIAELDI